MRDPTMAGGTAVLIVVPVNPVYLRRLNFERDEIDYRPAIARWIHGFCGLDSETAAHLVGLTMVRPNESGDNLSLALEVANGRSGLDSASRSWLGDKTDRPIAMPPARPSLLPDGSRIGVDIFRCWETTKDLLNIAIYGVAPTSGSAQWCIDHRVNCAADQFLVALSEAEMEHNLIWPGMFRFDLQIHQSNARSHVACAPLTPVPRPMLQDRHRLQQRLRLTIGTGPRADALSSELEKLQAGIAKAVSWPAPNHDYDPIHWSQNLAAHLSLYASGFLQAESVSQICRTTEQQVRNLPIVGCTNGEVSTEAFARSYFEAAVSIDHAEKVAADLRSNQFSLEELVALSDESMYEDGWITAAMGQQVRRAEIELLRQRETTDLPATFLRDQRQRASEQALVAEVHVTAVLAAVGTLLTAFQFWPLLPSAATSSLALGVALVWLDRSRPYSRWHLLPFLTGYLLAASAAIAWVWSGVLPNLVGGRTAESPVAFLLVAIPIGLVVVGLLTRFTGYVVAQLDAVQTIARAQQPFSPERQTKPHSQCDSDTPNPNRTYRLLRRIHRWAGQDLRTPPTTR